MEEETKKKKAKGAPKARKGHRSPALNKRKPRNARHQEKLKKGSGRRDEQRTARRLARRMGRDGSDSYESWERYRRSLREVPHVQAG